MTRFATSKDGTRIAYWSTGSGPVLLVVHGAGGDQTAWRSELPLLEPTCTVVTYARRGRRPSGDTLPYTLEREVEDLVMLAERVQPACVLGHSFGMLLALEAARQTAMIPSLILYEAWPDPVEARTEPYDWLPPIEALAAKGRRAKIVEYGETPEAIEELHRHWRWPEWLRSALVFPREVRADMGFWTAHPVGERRWRDLRIPILLLYGELNPDQGQGALALAATLPNASVEMLPGQGHRANYEGPDVLGAAIRSFVDGLPAATVPD